MATSRRAFLASTAALAATGLLRTPGAAARPRAGAPRPEIQPRSSWGGDLAPRGALTKEAPGDVRFLLVHHSETPNGYGPEKVAPRLRNIFDYHTGTKGWPDIAYNYFVDAQGRIWEGRTGSLAGPVQGDATGGSQGHAVLCCFLGDHSTVPPTPAAVSAMARLTAWLAGTYQIDLAAGPTITFTSRGSNRWPAGTTVTTDPIAGHRDMSQTACPGDAAYPLVRGAILSQAQAIAGTGQATTTTAAPATTTTAAATTAAPTTSTSTTAAPPATTSTSTETGQAGGDKGTDGMPLAAAALGVSGLAALGMWAGRRRSRIQATSATDEPADEIEPGP